MINPSVLIVLLQLLVLVVASGQTIESRRGESAESDTTTYLSYRATGFVHAITAGGEMDTLTGNVRIVQDSLFMRCERAIIKNSRIAVAVRNVVIIHQDSIYIYADSLVYDGQTRIADLYGEVILRDGNRTLHTTSLTYNAREKIGNYQNGGTLLDADARLISRIGYYDVDASIASFKENVVYKDSLRQLYTDSLVYNYQTDRLYIVEPTRIIQDTTIVNCVAGIYDIKNDKAILSDQVSIKTGTKLITAGLLQYDGGNKKYKFFINPHFKDGPVIAEADTMIYFADSAIVHLDQNASYTSDKEFVLADRITYYENKGTYETYGRSDVQQEKRRLEADRIYKDENGLIVGLGRVIMKDTARGVTIWCDHFELDDSTKVVKAYNSVYKPLMSYRLDTSSLLLRADTLLSYTVNSGEDTIDYFSAYENVEFVKAGVGGISDSLSFNTRDSTLVLYELSYLWSDSTQMSGDTIIVHLHDSNIEEVELKHDAFVINQGSEGHFNQIRGSHMVNHFEKDQLKRAEVKGSAEMVYFVKDGGGKYKGINVSKSSRMTFRFMEDRIEEVRFYKNPESNVHEYHNAVDLSIFNLPGFYWSIDKKPVIVILNNM